MKKRGHRPKITEHYLIPLVLFTLNICAIHVLYAFEAGVQYHSWHKALVCISLLLLVAGLSTKQRILLIGSVCFYVPLLCWFIGQFTP